MLAHGSPSATSAYEGPLHPQDLRSQEASPATVLAQIIVFSYLD